jgi:hypothetical protein
MKDKQADSVPESLKVYIPVDYQTDLAVCHWHESGWESKGYVKEEILSVNKKGLAAVEKVVADALEFLHWGVFPHISPEIQTEIRSCITDIEFAAVSALSQNPQP